VKLDTWGDQPVAIWRCVYCRRKHVSIGPDAQERAARRFRDHIAVCDHRPFWRMKP